MLRKVLVSVICLTFALCTGIGCKKEDPAKKPASEAGKTMTEAVGEASDAAADMQDAAEGVAEEATK